VLLLYDAHVDVRRDDLIPSGESAAKSAISLFAPQFALDTSNILYTRF
jgi:hypothetical protein